VGPHAATRRVGKIRNPKQLQNTKAETPLSRRLGLRASDLLRISSFVLRVSAQTSDPDDPYVQPFLAVYIREEGLIEVERPGVANDEAYYTNVEGDSFLEGSALSTAGADLTDDGYIRIIHDVINGGGLSHSQYNSYLSGGGAMSWEVTFGETTITD